MNLHLVGWSLLNFPLALAMLSFSLGWSGLSAQETPKPAGETEVAVSAILRDIRDTLIRVRTETDGALQLDQAKLNLSTVFKAGGNGKLNLFVITFGGGVSEASTQSLQIVLEPPASGDEILVGDVSDALADAILQAYDAVQSAAGDDPPLRMDSLQATIRFVVEAEGGGGVAFKILPVSVELSGEVSTSSTQEIVLSFCSGACP